MNQLLNIMRMQAAMQSGSKAMTRMGLVSSYDKANYCAKVKIQPEGTETGWLPVMSPWVGNGWGMFAPPSIDDMVEVNFLEDDHDVGFLSLRAFNDSDRPLSVPSGEFWLVHKNGQFMKLLNNGKATISDAHGATITLNGDGTITSQASQWTHTGNVTIDGGNLKVAGDITDQYNTNTRTVNGMRTVYNGHTHNDPQGGAVAAPNQGM